MRPYLHTCARCGHEESLPRASRYSEADYIELHHEHMAALALIAALRANWRIEHDAKRRREAQIVELEMDAAARAARPLLAGELDEAPERGAKPVSAPSSAPAPAAPPKECPF